MIVLCNCSLDGYYSKYMTHEGYIRNPSNQNGELSFLEKNHIIYILYIFIEAVQQFSLCLPPKKCYR